jgi:hypothetical protein
MMINKKTNLKLKIHKSYKMKNQVKIIKKILKIMQNSLIKNKTMILKNKSMNLKNKPLNLKNKLMNLKFKIMVKKRFQIIQIIKNSMKQFKSMLKLKNIFKNKIFVKLNKKNNRLHK